MSATSWAETEERITSAEDAAAAVADGRIVAVTTDDSFHLVMAGQFATPVALRFISGHGRRPLRLALGPDRWDTLGLDPDGHPAGAGSPASWRGAVSLEAAQARVIGLTLDPGRGRHELDDWCGVHPLRTAAGGVLAADGAAEAALDLVTLAGCIPVAVMTDLDRLGSGFGASFGFSEQEAIPATTIRSLIDLRLRNEPVVERVVEIRLPTQFGDFNAIGYRSLVSDREYVVLIRGDLEAARARDPYLHVGCAFGDVFRSNVCSCRARLLEALETVAAEGGVLVYVPVGAACADALNCAAGSESRPADHRLVGQILMDLGVDGASVTLA